MEENEMINEINEGAVDVVYEEVTNNNVLGKITVVALIAAAGVGVALYIKKRKERKNVSEEIVIETDLDVDKSNEE